LRHERSADLTKEDNDSAVAVTTTPHSIDRLDLFVSRADILDVLAGFDGFELTVRNAVERDPLGEA
jgi:hypothetical protein